MFLIQIAFESSEYSLMFGVSWTEYRWMSNPKGPKKSTFLQKVQEQTDDSENLRRETLSISVYECVNIRPSLCQMLSYGYKKMAT